MFGLGLVYDFAFISYFSIPFVVLLLVLPNKWLKNIIIRFAAQVTAFLILYSICFGFVAEWFFWEEFKARFNFISVDYLIYRREVTDNIVQTYPVFWILPVLFVIAAVLFFFLRPSLVKAMHTAENFSRRLAIAICIFLIPFAAFLFLSQSQRRLSDNNYVNELASNGPYQLFAAFRNNMLDFRQFYATGDDKALSQMLKKQVQEAGTHYYHKGLYNILRRVEDKKPPKKLNVILISVESLSAKFLSRFGKQKNITPFMDEWFKKGKLFTNFYATGTRTVRGLEAITLSIPPTPGRSIIKRPDNKNMYSLGKVFKDMGYDTVFLYGGRGYFDNMNAFFSGNGYRIVDQTNFSDKEITFKNAWGVSDEDLFNRTITEANKVYALKKPFFFHIMTTTNHQPFTYPEGKIDLPPGEGGTGSGRDGGVKFTDYALGRLVKKAKEQPWFDDTVFVILADHCAASAGKIGLPVKKYHIPLFIYAPKYIKPGEIDRLSSQIDVGPTLLALLNFSYDSFFFGKNILAPDFRGRALIANYQKLGFMDDKELLILSPGKMISLIDRRSKTPSLKKITFSYPQVKEMTSYYQGADYVFRNKLNRWAENNADLTKD
ncbi:MAG: LTA synthase family protein [Deltaproteobacteria bacterium]|nr:LTA synthase family protein [Deltaproteobacteria bacterium]